MTVIQYMRSLLYRSNTVFSALWIHSSMDGEKQHASDLLCCNSYHISDKKVVLCSVGTILYVSLMWSDVHICHNTCRCLMCVLFSKSVNFVTFKCYANLLYGQNHNTSHHLRYENEPWFHYSKIVVIDNHSLTTQTIVPFYYKNHG